MLKEQPGTTQSTPSMLHEPASRAKSQSELGVRVRCPLTGTWRSGALANVDEPLPGTTTSTDITGSGMRTALFMAGSKPHAATAAVLRGTSLSYHSAPSLTFGHV